MSIIIHRCPGCGHRDIDRNRTGMCSQERCRCMTPLDAFLPPEVVPTFKTTSGASVSGVVRPGTRWPVQANGRPVQGATTLCRCDECKALFEASK